MYCHDIAAPVVRRKKHRKTTSAVEDGERARRLDAEQLAYEQECEQNEHGLGNSAAAAAVTTDTNNVFQTKSWNTESATPETQASSMTSRDKLDHSRSFGLNLRWKACQGRFVRKLSCLRMVQSTDGQAPAPMTSREPKEVRSFGDETAVSSEISPFTRTGSVAASVGAAVAAVGFRRKQTTWPLT